MEVLRADSGHCTLALQGVAREAAERARASELSVSLSRDGEHATAVAVALTASSEPNYTERQ